MKHRGGIQKPTKEERDDDKQLTKLYSKIVNYNDLPRTADQQSIQEIEQLDNIINTINTIQTTTKHTPISRKIVQYSFEHALKDVVHLLSQAPDQFNLNPPNVNLLQVTLDSQLTEDILDKFYCINSLPPEVRNTPDNKLLFGNRLFDCIKGRQQSDTPPVNDFTDIQQISKGILMAKDLISGTFGNSDQVLNYQVTTPITSEESYLDTIEKLIGDCMGFYTDLG